MEIPDLSAAIVQTVREPLLVLDANLRVVIVNRSFQRAFAVTTAQTMGKLIYELGDGQWDIPALRTLLEEILPADGSFDDYSVVHHFPGVGRRTMLLNARRLQGADDKTDRILLAFEDVTDRRLAENELARQRQWFETTLSSIGDAVIATDADALVTYLNPTAERMTGWSAVDARGDRSMKYSIL